MSEKKYNINSESTWQEITPGGTIYTAANSEEVHTGDWRSRKPIWLEEKCKQCGLCLPVCPDNAIEIKEGGARGNYKYDYCKGCGVCAKACPFAAIEMEE